MWYQILSILSNAFLLQFLLTELDFSQNIDSHVQTGNNPQASIHLNGDDNNPNIDKDGVIYLNPRVYNVDCSFELVADPEKIDRAKDLKLWVPVPREWDSQKAVKIISVQPTPHAEYEDPEYGNRILFWDFGKNSEKPRVDIKFRLESYKVHVEIDPEHIGPYNKTSKEYELYTQSGHTVHITPKVKELAKIAVGNETNPYLKAGQILTFVNDKIQYYQGMNRSIDYMISNANIDNKSGEEYFRGDCTHYSALFVALCRSEGIPARCVYGRIGWAPFVNEGNSKMFSHLDTVLSNEGFAGAQHHGLGPHMWAEFYLPDYGWIPVDPNARLFGQLHNYKVIMSKGRDIDLSPNAPHKHHNGYGFQWVPIHNGRVEGFLSAVYNIEKITNARSNVYHTLDPFPADGIARYPGNPLPEKDAEKKLRHWRQGVLSWPSRYSRSSIPDSLNLMQFYNDNLQLREKRDAFICHMLRRQLGDEKFTKLVDTYIDLRQKSNQAVSTTRFRTLAEDIHGESLDWFFDQWINITELPRLKLEKVTAKKDKMGWQVHGYLLQSGETILHLQIELAVDTKNGREIKKLCFDNRTIDFNFRVQNKPQKLIVDPDYEILKIQRMPPRLGWFWDEYPNYILIYGTIAETESNKTAAERFKDDYLWRLSDIIKADNDVNQDDLKNKCIILFGRPGTNKICQQFGDIFPIKFDHHKFTWQGITYDQPTQGVAQIVDNPHEPGSKIVLFYGHSSDATKHSWELYTMNTDASYVIFDSDKQLVSGDWEEVDPNLVWTFE